MEGKMIINILCLGFFFISSADAMIRCYTCGYTSTEIDSSCLTVTNSTVVTICAMKYCTIIRQEFLDPPGQVASFERSCTNEPTYINEVIEDSLFRMFFRTCTHNLCNNSDGIESLAGGVLNPYPSSGGPNLLVPGTRSTSANLQKSFYLLLSSVTFVYFLN